MSGKKANRILVEIYLGENNTIHTNLSTSSSSVMNLVALATMGKKVLDNAINEAWDKSKCMEGNHERPD
jgi:hypothetical protein